MIERLEIGYWLDERYYGLMGQPERSKKADLHLLADIFARERVSYAVIGGVALQFHQPEPRTTLDINIAVLSLQAIPAMQMRAAGFAYLGRHAHSDNWKGPGGTPVQFSAEPAFSDAIAGALTISISGIDLRVISAPELMRAKLRAAIDPAGRRSKQLQDVADIQGLLEEPPALREQVTASEQDALKRLLG